MSARLGDCFPPEFIARQAKHCIRPGAVFRIMATSTTPPKIKRIVVLGVNQGQALVGHLFINSKINLHVLHSDELRNLQIFLDSGTRDYLDHDSFLDCSDLRTLSIDDIKAFYQKERGVLLGYLSEEDLANAVSKTASARTVNNKLKRLFGLIP